MSTSRTPLISIGYGSSRLPSSCLSASDDLAIWRIAPAYTAHRLLILTTLLVALLDVEGMPLGLAGPGGILISLQHTSNQLQSSAQLWQHCCLKSLDRAFVMPISRSMRHTTHIHLVSIHMLSRAIANDRGEQSTYIKLRGSSLKRERLGCPTQT